MKTKLNYLFSLLTLITAMTCSFAAAAPLTKFGSDAADSGATWDLSVVWQRGKTSGPLRSLLDAMTSRQGS